ncbi:hypothetical protein BC832DRAFT_527987 [Gaertneriomyces semiglobifer]|nr:hypothetical protein BC832DRAFT_527987 [Gaertneriomyces semiglobifer]
MKETGTNSNRPIDSERDYRNTSRIYHGAQPNLSSTTTQAVSTPGNSADNNPANNANEKDPSRPPPSGNRPSSPVEDRGTIPIMLTWTQGGHNVWITGTFNSWRTKIPLVRSHADFTAIIDMPKGMTHRFKFIVDDEWRCADDLPIASDGEGNLVNYLEVFDEEGKGVGDGLGGASEQPDSLAQGTDLLGTTPPDAYTNIIPPPAASSTRPPPRLPPHLDKVLLNAHPVSATDQALLPTPSNHVLLNHMYACSIRDGVMALGATVRYRQKYVTVVLYRPVSV